MTDAARSHLDIGRSPSARTERTSGARLRRLRGPLHYVMLGIVILACLTGLDFLRFSQDVTRLAPPPGIKADGIVALTGGSARIDGGLALLADGRGARLLISGVNPAVGRRDIAREVQGEFRVAFDRDVDLGHAARDTIGNADEARSWAEKHGFRSLIVVTSDYHMPRSMVELGGAMPKMTLIPYPVSNPHLDMSRWWRHAASAKLLTAEYVKYTLARIRLAIESPWEALRIGEIHAAAASDNGPT